jgi:hypothetical protein
MNHARRSSTLVTMLMLSGTLALSAVPAPVSARTFDVNANGSMILQPIEPGFACAMERALLNRVVACAETGRSHHRSRAR